MFLIDRSRALAPLRADRSFLSKITFDEQGLSQNAAYTRYVAVTDRVRTPYPVYSGYFATAPCRLTSMIPCLGRVVNREAGGYLKDVGKSGQEVLLFTGGPGGPRREGGSM